MSGRRSRGDGITLDHVVIAVSDWARSNAFYRDVCGAELVELTEPPPTRWRYRFGDIQFNVHGPGMAPTPVARIPAEPGMADLCLVWPGTAAEPGMADLCLVWPGTAAEAIAHLREHGVDVDEGPVARHGAGGSGSSVYFRDPDGSLLEFISYTDPAAG